MSAAVSYERVRDQLERLKLEAALASLDTVLEQGQKQERLPVEILDELRGRELATRFERRVATNLRLSGIPAPKTHEGFDFEAQPSVPRETIEELAILRFLHQGENVVFLGPCGVGKSHLAVALALKAIERGHRAYFLSLHELVTRSRVAREKNRFDILLRVITRADLFLLDEVGYLPLESADATFLFEAVQPALRGPEVDHPHQQQELWPVGRDLPGPRPGHRASGPPASPRHDHQHPRRKLPAPPPSSGRAHPGRRHYHLTEEMPHAALSTRPLKVSNSKPLILSTSKPALTTSTSRLQNGRGEGLG